MAICMRTIVVFMFAALLCCPSVRADEEEVVGFDFTREFEEEQKALQKDEMEMQYFGKLEKLVNFQHLIQENGFTFAASEKMAQQNIQLQNLLDSVSRQALKRADHTGQQRSVTVDERFQKIQAEYISSMNSTINFMRRVTISHQQLKNSIEVINKKILTIAEELNEDITTLDLLYNNEWKDPAKKLVLRHDYSSTDIEPMDIYRFSLAGGLALGYHSSSMTILIRNKNYLKDRQLSPATLGWLRATDGICNVLIEKKGEFTELDTHFKNTLEHWKKFSIWLAEQNKIVPDGTWKLAAEMISVSANDTHTSLENYYTEYQKNYKAIYKEGPINNVAWSHGQDKDGFYKSYIESWDRLRQEIQESYDYYQKGVAAMQRLKRERQ